MNFIILILSESLIVLLESAPYMLLGFLLAGLLKGFVPETALKRHLAGSGAGPVLKAALIGVPIPLCSCGVIPAAQGLRQAGASKGAATAFLISTPETGVDSIAVNYALLDPIMTVVRPLAAFVTGATAGVLVDLAERPRGGAAPQPSAPEAAMGAQADGQGGAPAFVPLDAFAMAKPSMWDKFRRGMAFSFDEMLPGIGVWFLLGVVIAGLVGALIPKDGLERILGTGVWPMLAMLAAGIPLYVCATASTPIAAALALKGLSPGAALVFMLTGPATNAAGIAMVARMLGPKATGIYLGSIALCSLAFGLAVDALYLAAGLDTARWLATSSVDEPGAFSWVCAAALLALIVRPRLARRFKR